MTVPSLPVDHLMGLHFLFSMLITFLVLYLDNMVIADDDASIIASLKYHLQFEMEDLDPHYSALEVSYSYCECLVSLWKFTSDLQSMSVS